MEITKDLQYALGTSIYLIPNFITKTQCGLIKNYLIKSKEENLKPLWLLSNSSTSSYLTKLSFLNDLVNNVKECEDLETCITNKIKQILGEDCIQDNELVIKIENFWYNIQTKNSSLAIHRHQSTDFACALYINVDEYSSNIYFDSYLSYQNFLLCDAIIADGNNRPYNFIVDQPSKYANGENFIHGYKRLGIHPQIGDLLIFPAYLYHHSGRQLNMTDDRIVISMNVNIYKA